MQWLRNSQIPVIYGDVISQINKLFIYAYETDLRGSKMSLHII